MPIAPSLDHGSLVVLVPVYNDWESLWLLIKNLNQIASQTSIEFSVMVVDDGSTYAPPTQSNLEQVIGNIKLIEIIHLHTNLGHQRAIAVGLSEIFHRHAYDYVVVMDADGEDKPIDVIQLIQANKETPKSIIVAQRAKRSEGVSFRTFYRLYKLTFRILVGKDLDYGNFCLIPKFHIGRLVFNPMVWNHLAASVSRSGLSIVKLRTERGDRYYGTSRMKFERLISHGMSAISVYLDTVMIRILISSSLIMVLTCIGVLAVVGLRFFTDLAIPGWATTAVGLLSVLGLQALILSTFASFVILKDRSGIAVLPAVDASKYINWVERIFGDE